MIPGFTKKRTCPSFLLSTICIFLCVRAAAIDAAVFTSRKQGGGVVIEAALQRCHNHSGMPNEAVVVLLFLSGSRRSLVAIY